jgi:hypothetical protein
MHSLVKLASRHNATAEHSTPSSHVYQSLEKLKFDIGGIKPAYETSPFTASEHQRFTVLKLILPVGSSSPFKLARHLPSSHISKPDSMLSPLTIPGCWYSLAATQSAPRLVSLKQPRTTIWPSRTISLATLCHWLPASSRTIMPPTLFRTYSFPLLPLRFTLQSI